MASLNPLSTISLVYVAKKIASSLSLDGEHLKCHKVNVFWANCLKVYLIMSRRVPFDQDWGNSQR